MDRFIVILLGRVSGCFYQTFRFSARSRCLEGFAEGHADADSGDHGDDDRDAFRTAAALQRCKGRLWPFGWFWLVTERRRTKWANVNGAGLLPEFQGLGANVLLYTELAKTINAYGFESADLVLVNETNKKSLADMEAVGVKWYKRHRAYIRELNAP